MIRSLWFLVLAASLLAPSAARAAGNAFSYATFQTNVSPIVEEESDYPFSASNPRYVLNTTGCAWTSDDNLDAYATGSLKAGASASYVACRIAMPVSYYTCRSGTCADWHYYVNSVVLDLTAPVSTLAVSVCYGLSGRCFSPSVTAVSGGFEYRSCSQSVYADTDPALVSIANSGTGGIGVPDQITFTVRNPSGKTLNGLVSNVGIVNSGNGSQSVGYANPGCPPNGANGAPNSEYPFSWW